MVIRIPVGSFPHYYAIVDDEDYDTLSSINWSPAYRDHRIYAATSEKLMHTMITGFEQTDHINGIGLDNRRENLRPVNHSQNQMNSRKHATMNGIPTTSEFKGVSWNKEKGKWQASIKINYKKKHLGYFTNELDAARSYDVAAFELFGEFARLNGGN